MDVALISIRDQVATIEQEFQTFGTNVDQNRPLVTAVTDRMDFGLLPLIQSTQETMNNIPLITLPEAELQRIKNLTQALDDLGTQIQDLSTNM
jgi:hypothetical protein